MQHTLVSRHAKPAPRYTSYPTAPHFHDGIGNSTYRDWLRAIDPAASLSLYLHIPYCDTLCWFCGCNTKHTRRYEPVKTYLPYLKSEIATVAATVPAEAVVQTMHWGGGSPTILSAEDSLDLAAEIRNHFNVSPGASFSIEIDPRGLASDKIDGLAAAGVTRASIGVQDFDSRVQLAINRIQSFEETQTVISRLRAAGIEKINLDLIYGLPGQTERSVAKTLRQVIELAPDRLALFGYAHVPWMKRHQAMINEAVLPGATERLGQSQTMAELLARAGYEPIGMDHFALPNDPLTLARDEGRLRRNFQGYTDDPADALIGCGASSIGKLPQGYVQNSTPVADFQRLIAEEGLAVVKGYAMWPDDEMRAHVIERLICDFSISADFVKSKFGAPADEIVATARAMADDDQDGLVSWDDEVFRITPKGQPFIRNICAEFDAFLGQGSARHSLAV